MGGRRDVPSMELASSTEIRKPSSVNWTCALVEKAMQRSSRNNWRAELDTAVRMGASSCSMLAIAIAIAISDRTVCDGGGRASG